MEKLRKNVLLFVVILVSVNCYSQRRVETIDEHTKQNIAQALWMKEYKTDSIPYEILEKIESIKNSNRSFGKRFLEHLKQLESNKLSYVASRDNRYNAIIQSLNLLSPQQNYANVMLLGPESVSGYNTISDNPKFNFPEIDAPQFDYQVGWHFFVGNFTDDENNHYSVQLMFWQYALLPPPLAKEMSLNTVENQILELHLAISDPQKGIHYRANTVVVAGTTGLITFKQKPFTFKLGKNSIQSLDNSANIFPVRLKACGWDMGKTPNSRIEIDLSLENKKGYFMEGDGGCSPSIDGLGTLYYSASDLKLIKEQENVISINGKRLKLIDGSMWYDHQWATGFMPNGAPGHSVMRAAQNLTKPSPGGWDWFMFQFRNNPKISSDGETQLTISALHTLDNIPFYGQTGPVPPGKMEARFKGKYINASNKTVDVGGKMFVDEWVKSATSPNPDLYAVTNTWYPAKFKFSIDGNIPDAIKHLTATPIIKSGQFGFFSNGLEYNEGGAVVCDSLGNELGRGFAESTNYANCNETVLKLAGLPVNKETLSYLTPPKVSVFLKLKSYIHVLLNKKELQEIMGKARGY